MCDALRAERVKTTVGPSLDLWQLNRLHSTQLVQQKGRTQRVNAVVPRPMKISGTHGSPRVAAITASGAHITNYKRVYTCGAASPYLPMQ